MSKEDVDKAVREAEQFAAEDAKRKEEVDTRNQADQMVYQAEKTLDEMGGKLDASDKASVQGPLEKLKGSDTQAIKAATEELTKAFYAVSEKIYSQAGGQAGPGPDMGGQQPQGGDNVVDADYEVVDDDNK